MKAVGRAMGATIVPGIAYFSLSFFIGGAPRLIRACFVAIGAATAIALMYMAFYSDAMSPSQITDYLLRVVQPKLQAVPGVAKAELIGNKTYAMRIWLDPVRMAAFGITADEVRQVLRNNNYLAGVGQTKGAHVAIDLSATTDISQQQDFQNLVLRSSGDTLIRLGDVATTEMGAADYDSSTWFNGKTAIFIGIKQVCTISMPG